jgi:hypothetical protein
VARDRNCKRDAPQHVCISLGRFASRCLEKGSYALFLDISERVYTRPFHAPIAAFPRPYEYEIVSASADRGSAALVPPTMPPQPVGP